MERKKNKDKNQRWLVFQSMCQFILIVVVVVVVVVVIVVVV